MYPTTPHPSAEYQSGRPPQVAPFDLTEADARQKFLAWQRGAARLAPGGLLPPAGTWRMRPALLPFWMFDVEARVDYAGTVGFASRWAGAGGLAGWRARSWVEWG